MITTGDSIENPATGETVTFLQTAQDSDGETVVIDVRLAPGGVASAAHVHPNQTETFRVVEGLVGFRLGGRRVVATEGETIVDEPGTAHRFWNAGTGDARFVCEVRPALEFQRLLETMFALARDGKTNSRGVPHPLRLAAIAAHHRRDIALPLLPRALQDAATTLGAAVAWAAAELGPIYDGQAAAPSVETEQPDFASKAPLRWSTLPTSYPERIAP